MKDPRFRNELPSAKKASEYFSDYAKTIAECAEKMPKQAIDEALNCVTDAAKNGKKIYVAGNGGSAAISDHLCCDWVKGTFYPQYNVLEVQNLMASTALYTAIANDFGYEHTISRQLEMMAKSGDIVILISSSGNSPNVIKAAELARNKGLKVIGLTGFTGGKLKEIADISIHVPLNNYGMVEDLHQMVMHSLAQFIAVVREKKA